MIDTLAYDIGRENQENGWVSRYSYVPEWMIGLNGRFYSFKNGDLYIHDSTNTTTCNFYGIKYPASLTTEFNVSPLEKKRFKTVHLDSTDTWTTSLTTDLEEGEVSALSYEKKEADFFAYIRTLDSTSIDAGESVMMSTQGVGVVSSVGGLVIFFTTDVDTTAFATGDRVYRIVGSTFVYVGDVFDIGADAISVGSMASTPNPGDFIAIGKNRIAESRGLLGYFMSITITNSNDDGCEIFAVSTDIFKSYP